MCSRADVLACFGAVVLTCSVHGSSERQRASSVREHAGSTRSVPAAGESRPAQPTGLIAGQVLDAATGQPVGEATVTLRPFGQVEAEIDAAGKVTVRPPPAVVSDSQGRFVFTALRVGSYLVTAAYRSGLPESSAIVELGAGQQVTDVAVRLKRSGSISGTVRDDAGDAVAGMKVDVFLKRTTGFKPILLPRGGAVTDDRGQFRIGALPPGDYLLCACGRDALPIDKALLKLLGATPPTAAAVTQRLDASIPAFAPTFYPGRTRASEAHDVVVASGDDRAGIDITVRAITPRRISGQLSGLGINSASAFTLLLIPENDRQEAQSITAIESINVTANGTFDFVAVPPGRYSLEVYPTEGKHDLWASMPVTVGEQDVTGLVVPLWSGATVTGRVEFSGSSARPEAAALEKARVTLAPADFTPRVVISAGASGSVGHSVFLGPDGQFRIEGVPPGRYLVSAGRLGPDWQLTESVRTSAGMSRDPVVTIDENGLSGLVITMSDAVPALVLGTAELGRYEAPQTVGVLLFPADPGMWSEAYLSPGRFAVTTLRSDKTFRLTVVPPGEYFVMLVNNGTNMGPEQFEAWSRTAMRITLKPGETRTIELRK